MVSETRKQYTSWFNKEYDKNPGGVAEWTNPNTGKKEKHKLVKAGESKMNSIKDKQGVTYNNPSAMDRFKVSMSDAFSADKASEAGASLGTGIAEAAATKAGGSAMGNAVKAGMASGFNPYVMAGAVAIGALSAAAEKRKQKKLGEARAVAEQSKGEAKKGDIYGQMAKSIRGSLGGAQRKRTVNL